MSRSGGRHDRTRRAVVRWVGSVGVLGAAGCSEAGGGDRTPSAATAFATPSPSDLETASPSETPTASDTATRTPDERSAHAWTMFSHDHSNTGYNPETTGPREAVTAQWSFETDGAVRSSPAVVRGTVYVGSDDGNVYAIDAATGEAEWTHRTEGAVASSPAVLGDRVYVGSDDGNVYALAAGTGERVWTVETGGAVRSSPTVQADTEAQSIDSVVAIGSDDGSLYVLDAATGDLLKRVETEGAVVAPPMIYKTVTGPYWEVGVGSTDGKTYWWIPYHPVRGRDIVSRGARGAPIHAAVSASPIAHQDIWFRVSDAGRLSRYMHPPTTEWTFEVGDRIRTTPVVDHDSVFVGCWDASVYAVDAESGVERWAFETGGRVQSSPALADGVLYVGSDDWHVYALDSTTGEERWRVETAGGVRSSPAVVRGTVYVGSDDGNVYAFAAEAN